MDQDGDAVQPVATIEEEYHETETTAGVVVRGVRQ